MTTSRTVTSRFVLNVLAPGLLAALLVGACAAAVHSKDEAGDANPWARLHHKTAWVSLGMLDTGTSNWATAVGYTIIGEARGTTRIPRQGEVLELTAPTQVVILKYRHSGERERLISPADELLMKDDLVGVLPPGSIVRVYEVRMAAAFDGLQGVWVRVGPAEKPPRNGR